MAETLETTKVWRATRTSSSGLQVTEDSVALVGDKEHFVLANDTGIYLSGPISLIADAANIRRGGLFTGINDFLDMIPSTILTPNPKNVPFPPIFVVRNLAEDLAYFQSFLS